MILGLDTSAQVAVCLVGQDGAVLARRAVDEQRRHAELLAPLIQEVLAEAGVDRRGVTGIAVGTGPAPFTGLRAGLVTARTLALALAVPVHGVCSLDALALQAADDGRVPDGSEVLAVTDARRREVYAARYRVTGGMPVALGGPVVVRAQELADEVGSAVVVGAGAALYPDHLALADGAPLVPDPAALVRLAVARAAGGVAQPTTPLYLRRPDVTPSAGGKRATG